MTTIKAHFDGKTFVPDEPVHMPAHMPVTLHVDVADTDQAANAESQLKALDELEMLSESSATPIADWSRESIYTGTLDDPR